MSDSTTPRPWVAQPMGFNVGKSGLIIPDVGAEIHPCADVIAKVGVIGPQRSAEHVWADAALIVRAVNAHDDLVNVCTGLLECFEAGDRWTSVSRRIAAKNLRAALAKAKGTKR